ncbi:hypothetical protein FB45DRAFT_870455 [Roridomyces roridus]|uniref:Uncharacterized protein n=1 Tax=Roridomyces roridus TaxID=1738132 RepID=A0AAD7FIQ1_9AGAR|nr:hypothetical protein FB45DRAFT_870455 [Roridomyces roridus]
MDDVERARDIILMDSSPLSDSQRLTFLPVFFSLLDRARIPAAEVLEEIDQYPAIVEDISCAAMALDTIFALSPKAATGLSLWPRVWPWVQFIHVHHASLDTLGIALLQYSVGIVHWASGFRFHAPTYALMSSTPRFWAYIIDCWTLLTNAEDPEARQALLRGVGPLITGPDIRSHTSVVLSHVLCKGTTCDKLLGTVDPGDLQLPREHCYGGRGNPKLPVVTGLAFKDRWFLRTVLNHRFLQDRRGINVNQVYVLAANSTDSSPKITLTFFDFNMIPPRSTVHAEWRYIAERAERDEGYTQLHAARTWTWDADGVWHVGIITIALPLIWHCEDWRNGYDEGSSPRAEIPAGDGLGSGGARGRSRDSLERFVFKIIFRR